MEEKRQEQLLEALRKACPRQKFSLLSTMQRSGMMLLVVKGKFDNLHSWGFSNGAQVWWDIIRPTATKLGVFGEIRTLFALSKTEFVLYAPALGICDGVFGDMKRPVNYETYGDEDHRYYAGKCQNIDDVITYLQKKKSIF